jgi:hypothetical protein
MGRVLSIHRDAMSKSCVQVPVPPGGRPARLCPVPVGVDRRHRVEKKTPGSCRGSLVHQWTVITGTVGMCTEP